MTAARRWWLPPAYFLAVWLVLMVGGRSRFFRDPGTFWHTVVGDKILRDGFFDRDPFTFTFHGDEWIPHQWLGEVGMAGVHRLAGFDGLLAAAAALLAGLYAGIAVRLTRIGLHPAAVVIAVGLVVAASTSHFHVRPHLATIVGVGVTMMLLVDVDAGRAPVGRLLGLVPVYLVWANTHGGLLGGLTTLGLAGAGWAALRIVRRAGPLATRREWRMLAAAGVGCAAVAVATPYGADIARTWLEIMALESLPDIIREHARTDFRDPTAWPVAALGVGYLALLAGVPVGRWRVAWLLPLFWLVQAGLRVRHAPLFAAAAGIAAADLWPHTRWAAALACRRPDFYAPGAGSDAGWTRRGLLLCTAPVVAAFGLQAAGVRVPVIGAGWAVLDPAAWPVDLGPVLTAFEPPPDRPARLFNDYADGGYVIYHHPGYRVFVDDRCELFGDAWLVAFVRAAGSPDPTPALDAWQAEYGDFDFALTRTGTPFDGHFAGRPGTWQVLGASPTASFYRRTGVVGRPGGR